MYCPKMLRHAIHFMVSPIQFWGMPDGWPLVVALNCAIPFALYPTRAAGNGKRSRESWRSDSCGKKSQPQYAPLPRKATGMVSNMISTSKKMDWFSI